MDFFEAMFRLQLALLPIEHTTGVIDGDWPEVVKRLPEVVVTTLRLLPMEYEKQALEAVRERLEAYP